MNVHARYPVILYFVNGAVPSEVDMHEALQYGPNTQFRNTRFVTADLPEGQIETCDGVAGDVPGAYARKYPHASDVLERFRGMYSRGKNGQSLAPLPTLGATLRQASMAATVAMPDLPGIAGDASSPAPVTETEKPTVWATTNRKAK